MQDGRFLRNLLAALTVGCCLAEVACLGPLKSRLWGFHVPIFLPLPVTLLIWAATFGATVWLFRGSRAARLVVPGSPPARLFSWVVPGVYGLLFWLLRSRQTLLGDAWMLVTEVPKGVAFHVRQPGAAALEQAAYRLWTGMHSGGGVPAAVQSASLLSVACGVLFVFVAWGLGKELAHRAASASLPDLRRAQLAGTAQLACLTLLSQGYMQLFFGYLEVYAIVAALLAVYLLTGLLQSRGRLPLAVPLGVLLLALWVHLMSVVLLPSALFLVGRACTHRDTRRGAIRDLVLAAIAVVLLDRILVSASEGYSLWRGVAGILATATRSQGGGAGLSYLFSWQHQWDFLNEQALMGPLAAFLFVPILVVAVRRPESRSASALFLAIAAGTMLAGSWATSEPQLGYGRDWDLFAPGGVACTAAGVFGLCHVRSTRARERLLAFACVVSMLRLGAWVALNHSEPRSVARFEQLPLGKGRTEVALGNWHRRNGRLDEAVRWFERALQVDPGNSNAMVLLGDIYWEQGLYDKAAEVLLAACRSRPDKMTYRHNLVTTLEKLGRDQEALPHLEALCGGQPDEVNNWLGRARVLHLLGREAEAREVLQQARAIFQSERELRPRDPRSAVELGQILASLGQLDAALALFVDASKLDPGSADAAFWGGRMLLESGRREEARPYLQGFLAAHPEDARAERVRAWLKDLENRP